jgi:hypothetical protein
MKWFSKNNYSSFESCERLLCNPEPRFLLDINAAMRQPCDLLQQVPGSSSSSRHQRFDRQSRGGKDDQGDFLEEGGGSLVHGFDYDDDQISAIHFIRLRNWEVGSPYGRILIWMGIQVHSFDDVAGHAHMLDQSPFITPESCLGDSFQTAVCEAPFPVNVSSPSRRFVYGDLLSASFRCGRCTRLRLFGPVDRFACCLPVHR